MRKPTILLTGGSGFIGRNFIEQRGGTYSLLAPSHRELDLLDTQKVNAFFKNNKIDVVLHFASQGGLRNSPLKPDTLNNNLRIFFNIIKNRSRFKKMINLGSGAEYDKSSDIKRVRETGHGISIPRDDYGLYKYICSKHIEHVPGIYHLRLFGIFGKYEDYRVKFISNLICKYLLRLPLTMIQDAYFDYLDIDDLIPILDHFIMKNPRERFFNVGSGKRKSLLAIAHEINKLDSYSQKIIIQKKGLNNEYTCDTGRLMHELKTVTFTPLKKSLRKLYAYYNDNRDKLDAHAITEDSFNRICKK